jgi:WD40 repeat protein
MWLFLVKKNIFHLLNFIFVQDLNTLERIKKLKGHKEFVNSVDFSRKSAKLLCSGSDDNTVKVSRNSHQRVI